MKQIIINLIACLGCCVIKAQEVQIGQPCPDVLLTGIANHPTGTLKISELKGKWVILDFWGTGCTVCIQAFPKMDSLQKQFDGKIQILLVNEESKDSTTRFFAKRKKIYKPGLPMIIGDSLLSGIFPSVFKPHHVWIDPAGIVRFITNGHNANAKNIHELLEGKLVKMNRNEDQRKINSSKPIITQQDGRWMEKVESYSYIMHCIPGISVGNMAKPNHLVCNCRSIRQLFETAFDTKRSNCFSAENTVMLLVKDSGKYNFPADLSNHDDWSNENSYNYELKVPMANKASLYRIMQQQLQDFFKVSASIEKRKIKCLVLKKGNAALLTSKEQERATNLFERNDSSVLYFRHFSITEFYSWMKFAYDYNLPAIPLVNGTAIKGYIDISLDREQYDFSNLEKVKRELAKYGFELRIEEKLMDVLVIRDKE